jgi:predicted TIM-barrel fold metal-dependent hydrolase
MKANPVMHTLLFNLLFMFASAQSADNLLLKNYRPVSIYNIPRTIVQHAAFPVTDIHSHDYALTQSDIDQWVKTMDEAGISKTIIQTFSTGKSFDSLVEKYKRYPGRFELWCGFDYTGFGTAGWSQRAVAELERCYQKGARGIGELGDKGEGEIYSRPTAGNGIHIDDPQLKGLLDKCGELHMPVSIHIGEDQWMYEKSDSSNDGMMNAGTWHVNMNKPDKLNHAQLMTGLEHALRQHPATIFIACHLANCCADLSQLGKLLDGNPNLYADIAARYGEIAPIPRYAAAFIIKYQDRLLYGTDMGMDGYMYHITFRILETSDEHFYETDLFFYHWPLYGLAISKDVLAKIYHSNAEKLLIHP